MKLNLQVKQLNNEGKIEEYKKPTSFLAQIESLT